MGRQKELKSREEKIEACRQLLTHVPKATLDSVYELLKNATPWDQRRVVLESFSKGRYYVYFMAIANNINTLHEFKNAMENRLDLKNGGTQVIVSGYNPFHEPNNPNSSQVIPIRYMRQFFKMHGMIEIEKSVTFTREPLEELNKSNLYIPLYVPPKR